MLIFFSLLYYDNKAVIRFVLAAEFNFIGLCASFIGATNVIVQLNFITTVFDIIFFSSSDLFFPYYCNITFLFYVRSFLKLACQCF